MKKLLLILLSLILFGCSEKRIAKDELTLIGTEYYYGDSLFNGICFLLEEIDGFRDGQLEYEWTYKNGKKDGLSKMWDEYGQLKYERNYKDGKKNGVWKWWNANGQLEEEYNYKDGKSHGVYRSWYKNGQLFDDCNYKDGEWDGLQRLWYENGQLRTEWNSEDGVSTGEYKEWYDNGQLKYYATNNKNGHTDGLSKRWYENGQLKYVGLIKNDGSENLNEFGFIINKKSGVWEYYYENGRLESKKVYREGKLISQKCWDKYGSEIECE